MRGAPVAGERSGNAASPLLGAACLILGVAGGLVLASDTLVSLPGWLLLLGLASALVGTVAIFGLAWRQSRSRGIGLFRALGSSLWQALRFLADVLG
jgi:hypothetical protein